MRPLEIACPVCAQQPNEICVDQYRVPLQYYHAQRITDALAIGSDERDAPSREEFNKAVEESGLI